MAAKKGIIDVIRTVAESEVKKVLNTDIGVVTSVFPHSDKGDNDNYECNVKLKDKEVELRRVPVLTQHIGLSHIPHVGDLVLVIFVNGDINSPVILGRLYNDEDRPPLGKAEEIIYKPPYSKNDSLKRLNIVLPGNEDNVNIEVHDNIVTLKVGKSLLTVKDQGSIELRSEPDSSKCILIMDNKGLRIDTDADTQVHCKGSMTVECDGDISFKAQNISLESQQGIKLKSGTTLDIHSSASLGIKSDLSGSLEASGPLDVKSSAILTVQGTLVKIN
jgi:hypothetical protein